MKAESSGCIKEIYRLLRINEDKDFLNSKNTMDEIRLWHFDPESKTQLSVSKTLNTSPPTKAKFTRSSENICLSFSRTDVE